jgi:hypothetical protein
MWMTMIEHAPGAPALDRLHYECKICEAKAVVPPLGDAGI